MKRFLILLFCLVLNFCRANFVETFYLKINENKINLEFTIRAGNLCNGIEIYRTTDTLIGYKLIGVIPGICGNANQAVKFEFIDESPILNRVNYYKINFGGVTFEAKSSILFRKVLFNEIFIYPNPCSDILNWQIENDENKELVYQFYDFIGNEITRFSSINDINQMDISNWKKGVYYIIFNNKQGELIRKKFVVV